MAGVRKAAETESLHVGGNESLHVEVWASVIGREGGLPLMLLVLPVAMQYL